MLVKIQVTQEDINNGIKFKCESCPVALAIKRLLKPNVKVLVGDIISFMTNDSSEWKDVVTPERVWDFLVQFDNKRPVQPFSFELDIPEDILCSIPKLTQE